MRFTEVKEVPTARRRSSLLVKELEEFVRMGVETVKVTYRPDEYCSPVSCYSTLRRAAKREQLPINVVVTNGEVYLVRTDME